MSPFILMPGITEPSNRQLCHKAKQHISMPKYRLIINKSTVPISRS
jgi:hypothetical protein